MSVPESGPLTLQHLHNEFGGPVPILLGNYYRGGSLVPDTPANSRIPTAGRLVLSDFYGASAQLPSTGTTPSFVGDAFLGYVAWRQEFSLYIYHDDGGLPVTFSVPPSGTMPSTLSLTQTGYVMGTLQVLGMTNIDVRISNSAGYQDATFQIMVTGDGSGGGEPSGNM